MAVELPRTIGVPAAIFKASRASGLAKLAGRGITAFPPELIDPQSYLESGEKTWTITVPVQIDLSDNDIPTVPGTVCATNMAFNSLKKMELRNNKITDIADGLWTLPQLAMLGLAGNPLKALPEGVGQLAKSLTELDVSKSQLKGLPKDFGLLVRLNKLTLNDCEDLAALPDTLGGCTNLTALSVNHCKLTDLPKSLGKCVALRTLDISYNKIVASIEPAGIRGLTALESLNASYCRQVGNFSAIPRSAALLRLFLGHNRLVAIDGPALLGAPNLTELLLNNNLLEDLPTEIGALLKLKLVDFGCNSLQSVPTGLGYLPDLGRINYAGNPCEVRLGTRDTGDLKRFMRTRGPPHPALAAAGIDVEDESDASGKLYAKAKKLIASGAAEEGAEAMAEAALLMTKEDASEQQALRLLVAAAVASRSLDVSNRGLSALPAGADEAAPALQSLDLKGNSLTSLSTPQVRAFLAPCSGLKKLDASTNKLAAPLPPELASVPLHFLSLSKNQLTSDHVDGICTGPAVTQAGSLSRCALGMSLRELDLSHNKLRTLPLALFDLRRLETLNLCFNALGALACDAAPWPRLASLKVLLLSNNKLEGLGAVAYLPSLVTLDVCHNNLKRLPEELGACPNLTAILYEGNPQRLINAETVSKGGAAVKAWLVLRLPDGYEKPSHALEVAAAQDDPPPPPPPPPPSRPKNDIKSEIAGLESELKALQKDIDGGGGSLSTAAMASKKKEAAKCKSAIARLKADL